MEPGDAIRSYRLRTGRLSATSLAALDRLLPELGLAPTGPPLALADVFGRTAPVALEIGFGMGEATTAMAAAAPGSDVVAVEVHRAGVAALLRRLEDTRLGNVRVVEGDAVQLLRERVPSGALAEVRVFFPDPWPKARHAKRRLVDTGFVALVADRLAPGGRLHVATDWAPYAEHVLALLEGWDAHVVPRPPGRPLTRFEQRGLQAGRPSYDVVAVRP